MLPWISKKRIDLIRVKHDLTDDTKPVRTRQGQPRMTLLPLIYETLELS
jgi:hypothetical protein